MPDALNLAISALALPAIAASILSQVELWQRKEYRRDRMLASLMGPELRLHLYPYFLAVLAALVDKPAAAILVLLAYHALRVFQRGLNRPQFTTKARAVLLLTAALTAVVLGTLVRLSPSANGPWAGALLLVPVCAAVSTLAVNVIAGLRKRGRIGRARAERQKLSNLTVIGITGSYGKTSTKHFLAQLLPGSVATKEHRNAEFPVALDMLEQLPDRPALYVAEMGAYRRGEIAALARLTAPRVGVITAIGNQHTATFGSPENILTSKWELIAALPPGGVAVLNADDPALVQAAKTISPDVSVVWYSVKKPADVYVDTITMLPRSVSCRLHIANTTRELTIPLAGEGALRSAVAAAAAAYALGRAPAEIWDRCAHLTPYPQTMEVSVTEAGVYVIDDSYSANEHGVIAALKHLARFAEPDKRVVMVPLIELGSEAKHAHKRIGQVLAETGAHVYVFGTAHRRELSRHAGEEKINFYTAPQELIRDAASNLSRRSVVLLEGRIPDIVRKAFL